MTASFASTSDSEIQDEAPARPKRRRLNWWLKEFAGWGITLAVILVAATFLGAFRAPDLVGTTPSFVLQDLDGKTVRLEDFRGRPVLINVWATWCAPCRVELPALSRFARNHPDIQVLGLSTQSPPQDLERMAADLPYPTLILDDNTAIDWKITTLPTTLFVNEEGKIIRGHSGMIFYPQLWWLTR